MDDVTVTKVKTTENGALSATVKAPADPGLHAVKVLDSGTRKLIDGAMFLVSHEDD